MDHLVTGFNKLIIKKKGAAPANFFIECNEETKIEDISLLKKGFFDGDILGCVFCKQINGDLMAECYNFKFFDILFNRIKPEYFPQMVNVNAIIETKDKNGEEYILLIKREKEVYSYPEYWDFPAGLVPYDTELKERLFNRVEKDLGLSSEQLSLSPQPSFLVTREKFFCLYYLINNNISKEEMEELVKNNSPEREIIFVKKSEITKFLEDCDKIFPRFLGSVF